MSIATEPRALVFTAPEVLPPSENQARRMMFGSRGGAVGFHKRLDGWKQAAFYAWKQQRSGPVGEMLGRPCLVRCEVGFHVARRRDPSNYIGTVCKSMVDGLVLAGLWPDDTPEWVTILEPTLTVHSKVPNTVALPCKIHLTPKEA